MAQGAETNRRDEAVSELSTPHGEALKRLRDIAEYLARFSDNGQHRRIPGPDAGHCHIISKDLMLIADDLSAPSETAPLGMSQFASKADYEAAVSATQATGVPIAEAKVPMIDVLNTPCLNCGKKPIDLLVAS